MATLSLGANVSLTTNLAVGSNALGNVTVSGADNTAIGYQSMFRNSTGSQNTAIGYQSLFSNSTASLNTAVGFNALRSNTTGSQNTAVGDECMVLNTTGSSNTAIGTWAFRYNTTGSSNTAVGLAALISNSTANLNTAVGANAISLTTTGPNNVAVGTDSLRSNITGGGNTAVGYEALRLNTASSNTAVGSAALRSNTTAFNCTAVGYAALDANSGNNNTALGYLALISTTYSNCTALGANTAVTGDNQVQLGDSATRTYAYGAVLDRSDARDKTDIRDTSLGLHFIGKLRAREFRWDYREDYSQTRRRVAGVSFPSHYNPSDPTKKEDEVIHVEPEGSCEIVYDNDEGQGQFRVIHPGDFEVDAPPPIVTLGNITLDVTMETFQKTMPKDGSKKRTRFHQGLIAQEVKEVMDELGVDFAGFQDHSVKGGQDVLSIGYTELVGPLIKAVQELAMQLDALEEDFPEQ